MQIVIFIAIIITAPVAPTITSEVCFEDGSCRIEYSDGTAESECRNPEMGCS